MRFFRFHNPTSGGFFYIRASDLTKAKQFAFSGWGSKTTYEGEGNRTDAEPGTSLWYERTDGTFGVFQMGTQDTEKYWTGGAFEGEADATPPVVPDPDTTDLTGDQKTQGNDPFSTEFIDPVAGFLKGIGFNTGQQPTSYGQYQRNQAGPTFGTFRGQQLNNFATGVTPQISPTQGQFEAFANNYQAGGAPGQNLGNEALNTLEGLSNQGVYFKDNINRDVGRFVNPLSAQEVQGTDIAGLLNAGNRGAGLSPLVFSNVSRSAIQDLYSDFIANNPGGGANGNFINYATQRQGLNNYFG